MSGTVTSDTLLEHWVSAICWVVGGPPKPELVVSVPVVLSHAGSTLVMYQRSCGQSASPCVTSISAPIAKTGIGLTRTWSSLCVLTEPAPSDGASFCVVVSEPLPRDNPSEAQPSMGPDPMVPRASKP